MTQDWGYASLLVVAPGSPCSLFFPQKWHHQNPRFWGESPRGTWINTSTYRCFKQLCLQVSLLVNFFRKPYAKPFLSVDCILKLWISWASCQRWENLPSAFWKWRTTHIPGGPRYTSLQVRNQDQEGLWGAIAVLRSGPHRHHLCGTRRDVT